MELENFFCNTQDLHLENLIYFPARKEKNRLKGTENSSYCLDGLKLCCLVLNEIPYYCYRIHRTVKKMHHGSPEKAFLARIESKVKATENLDHD